MFRDKKSQLRSLHIISYEKKLLSSFSILIPSSLSTILYNLYSLQNYLSQLDSIYIHGVTIK